MSSSLCIIFCIQLDDTGVWHVYWYSFWNCCLRWCLVFIFMISYNAFGSNQTPISYLQTWDFARACERSSQKICLRLWKDMWKSLKPWHPFFTPTIIYSGCELVISSQMSTCALQKLRWNACRWSFRHVYQKTLFGMMRRQINWSACICTWEARNSSSLAEAHILQSNRNRIFL